MRYLQYGQIKTTNRQFQTFRDLKSERSDRSRIGHESMSFCGSPDKPGGLSIQLCKSEKKEFYIRYSS